MHAKDFIAQLPPVYWSRRHPSSYTLTREGKNAGIGIIAGANLGAWNLIHDKFDWSEWSGHEQGVPAWSIVAMALSHSHAGAPLADTVVALGPARWPTWWSLNREAVPVKHRKPIDSILAWKTAATK